MSFDKIKNAPIRDFIGAEGEQTTGQKGPEAIKSDIDTINFMFDPNAVLEIEGDTIYGGISEKNIKNGAITESLILDGSISTQKFKENATAPRSISDQNGNNILSTYATKSELSNEETARQNADDDLQNKINVNLQAVLNEAEARQNADSLLQNQISDEATARQNADSLMQSQISANTNNFANYQLKSQKNKANGYVGLDYSNSATILNNLKAGSIQTNTILGSGLPDANIEVLNPLTIHSYNIVNDEDAVNKKFVSDNFEVKALKNQPDGYCGLGDDGKIATDKLPALAITDTFEVASENAMLLLSAQKGDVAIRSDINKSFILSAEPASTLSNWKELKTPTDTVLSVNGKTGAVTITKADVGLSNCDNTSDLNKPISTAVQNALNTKQETAEKNQPNGYCGLDSSGKVSATQLATPIIKGTYVVDLAYKTGTLSVDSTTDTFTLNSHGFVNGDVVEFNTGTGALPGGITDNDYYYIINKGANTFQICSSFGGSTPLDITSIGQSGYKVRLAGVSSVEISGLNLTSDKKYALNFSGRVALKVASESIHLVVNNNETYTYFSSGASSSRTKYAINNSGISQKYNEISFIGTVWLPAPSIVAISTLGGIVNSNAIDFTSGLSASAINNGGKVRNVSTDVTSIKIDMPNLSLIRNGSVFIIERMI